MFDIGWPELLLIVIAALILFGPEKLPDMAKSLGKSIRAFKTGLKEGLEGDDEDEPKDNHKKPSPEKEITSTKHE